MNQKARGREDLSATSSRNFRTFLLLAQLESQEIGRRIAEARHLAGMTQEEVSDLLGVTTRSVQGYEAGEVVPYRHFARLEEILDKPIDWFLRGEPEENSDRLGAIEEELRLVRAELAAVRETLPVVDDVLALARDLRAALQERTGTS